MFKLVLIVYNEAIESEVSETLKTCGLENFTKIPAVFGKGTTSGAHFGNDIWPGRNNILLVVCQERDAKELLVCIKNLRKRLGKEGIKAFVLPIDDLT